MAHVIDEHPRLRSHGDLCLRKAIQHACGLDRLPAEREVPDNAERWRSYRPLSSGYLFGSQYEQADR